MGIGHNKQKFPPDHVLCYGGELRKKRAGRKQRPLSGKDVHHVVFKIHREKLRSQSLRSPETFPLVLKIARRYAKRFSVKVEQISVQGDHIHALIRTHRRSLFHNFFRVVAGQIAQRFLKEGLVRTQVTDTPHHRASKLPKSLWKYRPFSRIVKGWRAYEVARAYVALNEQEAKGKIPYRKKRLKGLSKKEWRLLNQVLSKI